MFTFSDLPPEIRALIWKFTVEPRTVKVRLTETPVGSEEIENRLVSTTTVPAPLQTCREARYLGLYKQAFSELGTERRYIWANLDIDMIFLVGACNLISFEAIAPLIKRLKIQVENEGEMWFQLQGHKIQNFINVEDICVICEDGWYNWAGDSKLSWMSWPCALENVLLFNVDEGGRAINPIELDKMFEERWYARARVLQYQRDTWPQQELADMVPP
ncbi:hypothetical protein V490_06592 [Pseudogymnoascus sp. VKM F-3557]|nr:hypothetical protein V490_06592 [Pseudogymnoascus sp. VKM F-3557]